jgi:hypothetical protein
VTWQAGPGLVASVLAVLPKCPLCLMSTLSIVGIGSMPFAVWLPQLFPIALVAALLPVAYAAARHRRHAPLVLAAAASVLLSAVWTGFVPVSWSVVGVMVFGSAAVWAARPASHHP